MASSELVESSQPSNVVAAPTLAECGGMAAGIACLSCDYVVRLDRRVCARAVSVATLLLFVGPRTEYM